MTVKDFIIIGGVVIGFLILIFGILVLKKMKKEEDIKSIEGDSVNNNPDTIIQEVNNDSTSLSEADEAANKVLNEEVQLENSSLDFDKASTNEIEAAEKEVQSIDAEPIEKTLDEVKTEVIETPEEVKEAPSEEPKDVALDLASEAQDTEVEKPAPEVKTEDNNIENLF